MYRLAQFGIFFEFSFLNFIFCFEFDFEKTFLSKIPVRPFFARVTRRRYLLESDDSAKNDSSHECHLISFHLMSSITQSKMLKNTITPRVSQRQAIFLPQIPQESMPINSSTTPNCSFSASISNE